MEWLEQIPYSFGRQFLRVLSYPILPGQRLFFLYLLSSFAFAIGVYVCSPRYRHDRRSGRGFIRGLIAFVFPREIWQHPSAWVDVRYFIPHQMLRLWIYTEFVVLAAIGASLAVTTVLRTAIGEAGIFAFPADHLYLIVFYTIVSLIVMDFSTFFLHYCQHKVPLLWEFHKVHHSAEVLHPLSNYREHPVDNFSYAIVTGAAIGFVNGAFTYVYGVTPSQIVTPVLGIGIIGFFYNFLGYNLRHSHIWLRWPGVLAYVFGCPAHHQIHHSCKPQHIDKNFAFQLPVWDVLFRTFYLPKEKEDLLIGLGDGTEHQYKSLFSIYTLPFVKLFKRSSGN